MNEESLHYLKAPADGLWSWDEGDCILWCDGTTVTFRQELQALLDWQGLRTLPPFEAVVLTIAALRGKVPNADRLWRVRKAVPCADQEIYTKVQEELRRRIEQTVQALGRLGQLPRDLLARPLAYGTLIEMVAEASESSSLNTEAILETLREPLDDWQLLNQKNRGSADHIPAAHVLHSAFAKLTSEQLAMRVATGCDRLLSPPEIDFPNSIRKLLGKLVEDRELAALAKLARDVMAAIYIPRALSEPENLPLGGAADISNRGSLDRLLLSELAHEDDVLAARVALNEALYLKREPPAQHSASSVAVLLDAGIRMWGASRLFGIAVALALGARAPGTRGCAFVADGKRLLLTDLLSRAGLTRAMGELVSDPEPTEAIPAFMVESGRLENPHRTLITHADTLEEPAMRKTLMELREPILIATVNEEGDFVLRSSDALDARPLCAAHLDLQGLFHEPSLQRCKPRESVGNEPAIYSAAPFPFLLPVKGNLSCSTPLSRDRFAVLTSSHRLYLTYGPKVGARLVVREQVPGRAILMEYVPALGKVVLLTSAWREGSIPLYLFDPDGYDVRKLRVNVSCPPAAAWIDREFLFLYYRPRIDVLRIDTGELAHSVKVEGPMEWSRGRFFEKTAAASSPGKLMTEWHALVNQGLGWGFEKLIPAPNDVVEVFDRKGEEGPWVVRETGGIQSLVHYREKVSPTFLVSGGIKAVSKDGERVERCDCSVSELSPEGLLSRWVLELLPLVATFAMRPRWQSVGVTSSGRLVLNSLKNDVFVLRAEPGNWVFNELDDPVEAWVLRGFVPHSRGDLKIAEWRSGLRAILDGDGLLHLQSDAPGFVEMTIGLCEGAVPIWMANGKIAGPPRFGVSDTLKNLTEETANLKRFLSDVAAVQRVKA